MQAADFAGILRLPGANGMSSLLTERSEPEGKEPDMYTLRLSESFRTLAAALLTVAVASSAVAQSTRISRTESDFNDLNRRLPSGEFGSSRDLSRGSILTPDTTIDYKKVDRRALANLMKEAFDQSELLYRSLDTDYRRYPQLRPLLADLNQLRNRTRLLNQDLTDNIALEQIVVDFRELDADWRLFSHRMSQATGLSTNTKQTVDRIDRIDQQIGQLFQVAPSLDRRELLQQLSRLDNALYNVAEEIRRDAAASRTGQLASDLRKLQQQVMRVEDMVIEDSQYDRIVTEYNRFDRSWAILLEQLSAISNSYVERAVRQAIEADSRVHELLWIEHTTSRPQLKQYADALIRDVDEFYNRTPLKLLLQYRDASETLQVANDFYGMVQNFKDNIDRNESNEALIESYRYVEEQGIRFSRTFSTMKSQAALVVLREIEDGIAALRTELNLGGTVSQVDTRKLIPIAASLENLSDQMDYNVRQWLNSARPTNSKEVSAASAAFVKRSQRLHRMMDTDPRLADLQREFDSLYEEFRTLNSFLGQCRTTHRQTLSELAAEVRVDLADLNSSLRL